MKLVIRGVLTTTSVVHQTAPETKGLQMKTNVYTCNGLLRGVPYVTANSVRGMIRRAAASLVLEQLEKTTGVISKNLYLSIVRGSFGRSAIYAGGLTFSQAVSAAKHPFAGLFGGGSLMLRSPWRIERDLIPVMTATAPLLPHEVQHAAIECVNPNDLLTISLMAPRDDFARLTDDARSVVEDVEAAYADHMANKKAQSAAKKADDTQSKDDLDNFATTECIVPGVPLYLGMTTSDITPAQAGMLLSGLLIWARNNALGGGSARGRGSFIPKLSLSIDGKQITDHLLTGDAPDLLLANVKEINDCLKACGDDLEATVSAAALNHVFPSEAKKEAKEPKVKALKVKAAAAPATETGDVGGAA